jgi:hypothetical protein
MNLEGPDRKICPDNLEILDNRGRDNSNKVDSKVNLDNKAILEILEGNLDNKADNLVKGHRADNSLVDLVSLEVKLVSQEILVVLTVGAAENRRKHQDFMID